MPLPASIRKIKAKLNVSTVERKVTTRASAAPRKRKLQREKASPLAEEESHNPGKK